MRSQAVQQYKRVIEAIGLERGIVPCLEGKAVIPLPGFDPPLGGWGHPPALIPIWDEGSGPWTYGHWRHWFVPRAPTFVEYSLDAAEVREVGRNFAQLVGGLVLRGVEIEGYLTPEAREFLESIEYPDIEEFERLAVDGGDDPSVLSPHVAFREALPLSVIDDPSLYTGDFPNARDARSWRYASSIELDAEVLAGRQGPRRLWAIDPKVEFDRSLEDGDLGSAWLALNCRGWLFRDACAGIQVLAERAGDSTFSLLADAWVEGVGNLSDGY